jgi:hypothetical protein
MSTIAAPIPARRRSIADRTGRLAGATYLGAWLLGLSAFGPGLAAGATDLEVAAHYADHRITTAVQSTLVHGVAAAALLMVLTTVTRRGAGTKVSHIAGVVGVGLSGVQLVLGLSRSLVATGSTTAALVDAIDRVDGAKLLAFAVMVGAAVPALRRNGWIGARTRVVGVAATATLAVAGAAYLLAVDSPLAAAAPALVLLVAWVVRLGVVADRHAA